MLRSWKAAVAGLFLIPAAHAQQVIMDQEFMDAATTLAAPLRKELSPQTNVHYLLVNDPSINAFVTGENIIYVHSGLVAKALNASALQGVLAHELGHIASNHLMQRETNARQAGMGALAGVVMGIGAAAAGSPQAATALMMGGQAGAMQMFMAHTRTQEAEADKRAVSALHDAGLSAQGMVDMFTTLRTESQLSYDAPPPWLVTHPLPPERLANLNEVTKNESAALKSGLLKTEETMNFARLQAKVFALTASPASVLRKYTSQDPVARYARAMAYAKQARWDMAQGALDPLLRENPHDAYYRELKAKMALSRGDLGTANDVYSKLVEDYPKAVLFQYELAEILRNQNDFKGAIARYERVTRDWPEWADPWMGLGLAYGSLGRIAESHLARTQGFIVAPDYEAAKQSLALARNYLKDSDDQSLKDWGNALQQRLDNLK
ncbi:MAG: hypothetical protein DI585_06480 [Pseudomonas fluorescens]|nr:MAG: hypothetical protein DI585_06480 [Pseudomonas fluorescens]